MSLLVWKVQYFIRPSYSTKWYNFLILKNIYLIIVLGESSYGPVTIIPKGPVFALFF